MGIELKIILTVSEAKFLENGLRYFLRKRLKRIKFKIITIEVAKAMPPAPRILERIIFRIMLRPTQMALMIRGVAVFLKE